MSVALLAKNPSLGVVFVIAFVHMASVFFPLFVVPFLGTMVAERLILSVQVDDRIASILKGE